jgi:hypothetical protein
MNISAKAVKFDDDSMWIELSDGRALGVPYAWFPRLLNASKKQREAVEIGRFGLHWEAIDEDISIAGLLAGRRDQTIERSRKRAYLKTSVTEVEMSNQRYPKGLDGRMRDGDGEIRKKRSDTLVRTLRAEYGDEVAKGYRADTKLGTVLNREGLETLDQLLKKRR